MTNPTKDAAKATADALVDSGINDVAATHDVGLDGFEGVVFAGGNLFESSRVNDYRNAGKGAFQAIDVTNVSNEIAEAGMVETGGAHLMLLEFIATEDDQPMGLVVAQHDLDKLFTKRARPTCDQYRFLRPIDHANPSQRRGKKRPLLMG